MSASPTLFDFLSDETAGAEEKAAFYLRLKARGVQDIAVLRTLELVPRSLFVPHRYADLAQKDVALPIGCGQTISEPWIAGRMIEALQLSKNHSVLEIGSGSGYTAAILAQLAGEVMSIERFQSLAIEARARLNQMGVENASIVWADGLAVPQEVGPFDRIFIEAKLEDAMVAGHFAGLLAEEGILVAARQDLQARTQQQIVSYKKRDGSLIETFITTARMQPLLPGLSQAL